MNLMKRYKEKISMTFKEKYNEALSKCPEIAKYYDGTLIDVPSKSLDLRNPPVVSCINGNTSDIELVINGERTGTIIRLNANHESEEFTTDELESKGITGLIPNSTYKIIAFGANVQIKFLR